MNFINFLFSIKEKDIYLIITIFGIKIVLKPTRLRHREKNIPSLIKRQELYNKICYDSYDIKINEKISEEFISKYLNEYISIIEKNKDDKINLNIIYANCINTLYNEIYTQYYTKDKKKCFRLLKYLEAVISKQIDEYGIFLSYIKIFSVLTSDIKYNRILDWYNDKIYSQIMDNYLDNFLNAELEDRMILITELNYESHGEVIPGIVKYFFDLNYKVDVLISNELYLAGILNNFINNKNIRIFNMEIDCMIKALNSKKIKQYSGIFITSYYLYYYNYYGFPTVLKYIRNLNRQNKKIIILEHHLELVNKKLLKKNKIAVINNFNKSEFPIYINPHYFGDINITSKNKEITNFIVIGNIEDKRKNHNLLIESLEELIIKGINNFKLTIIGRGNILFNSILCDFIEFKGRVDYPTLYKELESSDFILPMLDPENAEHDRYLKYGVSGSMQLIYGFRKICIINKKFASVYGLNESNSIIYDKNKYLIESLKRAIYMPHQEYMLKQNNLKIYTDNLYKQSLENLKTIWK